MKKSTFFIFFVLVILVSQAQPQDGYYINFTGEGDTIGIGAVQVINMTDRDTVNLNGSDILHLNPSLGVSIHDANKKAIQLFPNPMTDQSIVKFVAIDDGDVQIKIVDLSGKIVSQISRFLYPGTHCFRISGLSNGIYIVQVEGRDYSYTAKLVCKGNMGYQAKIEYLSSDKDALGELLKSKAEFIQMRFTDGDILLFRGSNGDFKRLVTESPTQSITVIFKFVNCRDADHNNYETVKIGNQTWMTENLRTTHFNDHNEIHNVVGTTWEPWEMYTTSAFCWYKDDRYQYEIPYGGLYNFYAATDPAGVCPINFHVPDFFEWEDLANTQGYPAIAGGAMKTPGTYEAGNSLWYGPNTAATNISGFCGIPGGYRSVSYPNIGKYIKNGEEGRWWSLSLDAFTLSSQSRALEKIGASRQNGLSIRCVRDY